MKPEEIQRRVIYRDAMMLVLDKPAGIPCHAGRGKGDDNLEKYFDHLRYGLPKKPALAHRLDKNTSGCLVLGRHRQALNKLGDLFKNGKIEKTYIAVVEGQFPEDSGTISLPMGRKSPDPRNWHMMVDMVSGQEAITDYKVLGRGDKYCWLELKPRTGRTHQLRVHCAAMGCPIIGDVIYGAEHAEKMLLHAFSVEIPLYKNKNAIRVAAKLPDYMGRYITSPVGSDDGTNY